MMTEFQRELEDSGTLYGWCGRSGCPGILVPFDRTVLCTESVKHEVGHHEEGGGG